MSDKITEFFGSNVFSTSVMQERLPKNCGIVRHLRVKAHRVADHGGGQFGYQFLLGVFGSPKRPPISRLSRSGVMVECVISCSMVE